MEELFAGDDNEVVFQPEGSSEEIESRQTPEERGLETIIVESLPELLVKEPGLGRYLNNKKYGLFRRLIK
ncbi:MAG: hypothetical protein KJ955_04875 [Nanoarchaeota archaeon]|nr:hypothetical protein [Nanoarchaeota archaeon]